MGKNAKYYVHMWKNLQLVGWGGGLCLKTLFERCSSWTTLGYFRPHSSPSYMVAMSAFGSLYCCGLVMMSTARQTPEGS